MENAGTEISGTAVAGGLKHAHLITEVLELAWYAVFTLVAGHEVRENAIAGVWT